MLKIIKKGNLGTFNNTTEILILLLAVLPAIAASCSNNMVLVRLPLGWTG